MIVTLLKLIISFVIVLSLIGHHKDKVFFISVVVRKLL